LGAAAEVGVAAMGEVGGWAARADFVGACGKSVGVIGAEGEAGEVMECLREDVEGLAEGGLEDEFDVGGMVV
jgi:hypothetical protein